MIPQSLRTFVARLRKETDAGTLDWNAGSENAFFCNHKDYTVHISYQFDEERELPVYRMGLTNMAREAGFTVNGAEDDIQEMRDLYSSASVSAAGFHNIESDFFD